MDPLQLKLQQVNGVGQGLIQSAGKNCDVQGLEHDMEEINTRWNTLNKKVRMQAGAGPGPAGSAPGAVLGRGLSPVLGAAGSP